MPETKSRYQLERSDYTNHLTVVVNRQALKEGRQALRNSEKCIDKQHDDVIFTIYAPTGRSPDIVKILTLSQSEARTFQRFLNLFRLPNYISLNIHSILIIFEIQ